MTAVVVEVRIPPVCPACGVKSKSPHHPPSLEVDPGQEPTLWWCRTCLRAKVHASHGADCRCGGCATVSVVSPSAAEGRNGMCVVAGETTDLYGRAVAS